MKFIVLAALFAYVAAQQGGFPIYNDPCSVRSAIVRPEVKTSFSTAAYTGLWFQIGRYQQHDEPIVDCLESQYTWSFLRREFEIRRLGLVVEDNEIFTRSATALLAFPDADPVLGLLNVTYFDDREADETNYYILGTDYFQYAIGWGCENIEFEGQPRSREFAWLLSRTPDLPETYRERVDNYIERFFDSDLIRNTTQERAVCFGEAREAYEATKLRF